MNPLTIIYGGGEFASCIASYLFQAGLPVAMVVNPRQVYLRHPVCLGQALTLGHKRVGEVEARAVSPETLEMRNAASWEEKWKQAVWFLIHDRAIPLWSLDDFPQFTEVLSPGFLVASEVVPSMEDWVKEVPVSIGLHPPVSEDSGFSFLVETGWNYHLGRAFRETPLPATVQDFHFFKKPFVNVPSPIAGTFLAIKKIGESIRVNEPIGTVEGIEIRSPYEGQIWGLFPSGRIVSAKAVLALIFQGKGKEEYSHFGFDHRAVAGTVLRIILQQSGLHKSGTERNS